MPFVLILGGARAGKSAHAERLGEESGRVVTFVATATARDDEMAERIGRHRSARPGGWGTVEAPVELLEAIRALPRDGFVIVDCLTLWVANLLEDGRSPDQVLTIAGCVADELAGRHGAVVSNEVGLGIVPATELGRKYRDLLGAVNARFAAAAGSAILMVAGRSLELA
jgi:adenosyl cobinamide kinase/adenosyl cobinamide phosphate guanylyltransferase